MAAPEQEEQRHIPIITAVHPENKAYFKEIAAPKKVIREGRSKIAVSCSQCMKPSSNGAELLKCSKCKIAWYCSRECQKAQWPTHKKVCKEASSSMPKFLGSFIANPLLNHTLQVPFVLAFDLRKNPILDQPLIARCDVQIEPSDMTYIMSLAFGRMSPAELAKGTEGMLQVKTFIPLDAEKAIDITRMEVWKNTKYPNKERGFAGNPTVLVDFHMKGTKQTITYGLVIEDSAIERVKAGAGFAMQSAIFGGQTEVPLTTQACLDFINMHIRADKKNQLRLRTHMTKEDVDNYRNAVSGDDEQPDKSE
ncbi:hypothetical protein BDN70DRAFT_884996 [Pholiota conissans]|uniref:MYND-type domain-containing protein n=1 Tax=Pholiota conissans TaxID=109636 RepID=A0A9P5YUW4_9AGAR|nr:hypothetical protein BDN70DRAFT_884996 [Pholiota conissans]